MHKTVRHGLALTVLLALFPSLLCARPPKSATSFKIRSWQTNPAGDPLQTGKCLDYGKSPSPNSGTVFLNDCVNARAIRVVEVRHHKGSDGITRRHQVMLFAGNLVLGIHNPNPRVKTLGGSGSALAFSTQSEFVLELQIPWNAPHAKALVSRPANQIFAYDGDSIILESSRPCVNTDLTTSMTLCPPPPPQLVIQVQNARGANGSPIVAGVRNLADNEFWDFVATDGSGKFPTSGFISMVARPDAPASSATPITSNWQLWNAICTPQVAASTASPNIAGSMPPQPLLVACSPSIGWGSVVVVAGSDPNECGSRPGVGPCLDFSGNFSRDSNDKLVGYAPLVLPPGVTLRGNRRGVNFGPQLHAAYTAERDMPCAGMCMITITGDYARVTGLRVRGQSRSTNTIEFSFGGDGIGVDYVGLTNPSSPPPIPRFQLSTVTSMIAIIDHNDMSDWEHAPVAGGTPFFNSPKHGNRCGYLGYSNPKDDPPDLYKCDENFRFAPNVPNSLCSPQPSCSQPSSVAIAEDPIKPPGAGTMANLRVTRNFLHHNLRDDGGYGVAPARALIDGNTFLQNRHDISAAAEPHNEYRASHNLVLSSAYGHYGTLGLDGRLQDFDMHGTANVAIYAGGAAGYYVEIDGNTFLGHIGGIGGAGHDYLLRGYPIVNTYYHDNRSLRTESDAVQFLHCIGPGCTNTCGSLFGCNNNSKDFPISVEGNGNQWADSSPPYTDPTARLGVGDFDGDDDDDLFLTTGASWYYSPAGSREWRFLSAKTDRLDTLLLGDFDGDGRTDVVGMNPSGQFDISWGGISDWEVINNNPCPQGAPDVPKPCPKSIHNMVVGDFDGDGTPDIFYADGKNNWYISYGGTKPFKKVNDSSFPVQALRFGHFSVCGTGKETDVFGIVSGKWMVTCGALGPWIPLPVSLTNRIDGLVVADFDGDGIADVATNDHDHKDWMISFGGVSGWKHFNVPDTDKCASQPTLPQMPGIGHFARNLGADVLLWDKNGGNEFCIAAGGNAATKVGWTSGLQPYSTQDMR